MKIIKRNGSEANFDIDKIIAAVSKANNSSENNRLSPEQIQDIAEYVEYKCSKMNRAISVEAVSYTHLMMSYTLMVFGRAIFTVGMFRALIITFVSFSFTITRPLFTSRLLITCAKFLVLTDVYKRQSPERALR